MNYLFFDLECADGRNICEFGYVIVDEKFNIINKDILLINPECQFNLVNRKKGKDLHLAYDYNEYKKYPNFEGYYEQIKGLINMEDCIILGHSILNDLRFLETACVRYNLPKFDINCFDTQQIIPKTFPVGKLSLIHYFEELKIDIPKELTFHRSIDDAIATMELMKGVCNKQELSLQQILEKFEPLSLSTITISKKAQREIDRKNLFDKIIYLRKKYASRKYKQKVCFSNKIDFNTQLNLIEDIFKNSFEFTNALSKADIYVKGDIESSRDRFLNNNKVEKKANLKVFTLEEFYNFLLDLNNK